MKRALYRLLASLAGACLLISGSNVSWAHEIEVCNHGVSSASASNDPAYYAYYSLYNESQGHKWITQTDWIPPGSCSFLRVNNDNSDEYSIAATHQAPTWPPFHHWAYTPRSELEKITQVSSILCHGQKIKDYYVEVNYGSTVACD